MATHTVTADERIARVEESVRHTATKGDLSALKADLHALEARLTRWMIGLMVAASAIAATIASIIARVAA